VGFVPPPPPPPLTMTYPHPENDVLPNGINRSFDLFCFVLQQKEAGFNIGTEKIQRNEKAESVHVEYAAVDVVLGCPVYFRNA
jgi:hypothetical protein